jgi:general secretion pathway protein I
MTGLRATLREEDGFTLVETIVAFAILALVISTAVAIVGNGSFRQRFDQARMMAFSHAQSELAALGATGAVKAGTMEGRYGDGSSWRISAAPLSVAPPADAAALPYAVSVEIFAGATSRPLITLKTVVIGRAAE